MDSITHPTPMHNIAQYICMQDLFWNVLPQFHNSTVQ